MKSYNAAAQSFVANYRSPKTILGFFAIVVGILVSGATLVIGILSGVSDLRYLIVPILVFAALLVVAVLVGVFITAWKDPTVLMLGQISGEVFIENRRLTLGDHMSGEYSEDVAVPRRVTPGGKTEVVALPSGEPKGTE
jgi:hypothetical protein